MRHRNDESWLVVEPTPLKSDGVSSSVGMMTFLYGTIRFMFQTTNQSQYSKSSETAKLLSTTRYDVLVGQVIRHSKRTAKNGQSLCPLGFATQLSHLLTFLTLNIPMVWSQVGLLPLHHDFWVLNMSHGSFTIGLALTYLEQRLTHISTHPIWSSIATPSQSLINI